MTVLRVYFASLRLAIGLILIAVALIIGCQGFGLIPDTAGTGPANVTGDKQRLIYFLGCFIPTSLVMYTLVIARVLSSFESVQVVPDRVRQALDALAEGLLVLDERDHIVLANQSFTQTVGITAEELIGRRASSLSWVTDERARADDYPWRRASDANELLSDQLMRYRVSDNVQRIFSINAAPIRASGRRNRGTLVTLRDVTQLEGNRSELKAMLAMIKESRDEISKKNRELEVLATQDALTGCFNRRAFFEKFEDAFRFAQEHGEALACLMVDNDHFKIVNDTYGHHIGDEVLRRVGSILQRLHGGTHAACRFGGEEFCILLPGYGLSEAAEAAEKIRREISELRLQEPADLCLSVSVGVSEMMFGAADPQALINQADACLYVAKRAGRNRVVIYHPSMNTAATQGLSDSPEGDQVPALLNHAGRISPSSPAVKSLMSALAFRDADTAEHCRRVADHCVRTARDLLDESELSVLEVAALLHDIGKIGIPDHILLKPESLTEDEWKLMSLHDQIGVEIVENLFASPELLSIIRYHHCFFGGRSRIASCPVGPQIPLSARILAVADSYDAMVSERVYRIGRSHDDAIAELKRCCGSQFDPTVVERFIARFDPSVPQMLFDSFYTVQVQKLHFGKQVDRLAVALASQNPLFLKTLTGRLRAVANARNLRGVVHAADRLHTRFESEVESWSEVLRDSQELIRLCREAQLSLVDRD